MLDRAKGDRYERDDFEKYIQISESKQKYFLWFKRSILAPI